MPHLNESERTVATTSPTEQAAVTFGNADEAELRASIRRALPANTFEPRRWRYVWFVVLQAVLWSGFAALLWLELPWWAQALIGVGLGHTLGAQGFLAHEALHGALGGPRWLQNAVGWLGFGPFLVPPEFWRRWHNQAHHGHTNDGDKDPDNFGTLRRYQKNPKVGAFLKLAPGSGSWLSALFLTYSFVFHAQMVLWLQSKHRREFEGFSRRTAIAQSLACAALWLGLAALSGWTAWATVLLPLAVANTLVQSYILTNHFLRPMAVSNNPLDNAMSVRVPAPLDALHFHFSHHVEHHLFPGMPSHRAPRVRAWLLANEPARYVCPPHWLAVALLYETPRVYRDARTLVDLGAPGRVVDLVRLQAALQPAEREAEQPVSPCVPAVP